MPSSAHEDMPGEVREQLVFSPPTWDLEIELRSRGLVASASAHWVITLDQFSMDLMSIRWQYTSSTLRVKKYMLQHPALLCLQLRVVRQKRNKWVSMCTATGESRWTAQNQEFVKIRDRQATKELLVFLCVQVCMWLKKKKKSTKFGCTKIRLKIFPKGPHEGSLVLTVA